MGDKKEKHVKKTTTTTTGNSFCLRALGQNDWKGLVEELKEVTDSLYGLEVDLTGQIGR